MFKFNSNAEQPPSWIRRANAFVGATNKDGFIIKSDLLSFSHVLRITRLKMKIN